MRVYIEEEVIDIMHGKSEIIYAELIWKNDVFVKCACFYGVLTHGHSEAQRYAVVVAPQIYISTVGEASTPSGEGRARRSRRLGDGRHDRILVPGCSTGHKPAWIYHDSGPLTYND